MKHIIKYLNYINLISAMYLAASSMYYYPIQKVGFYVFFASYVLEILLEQKWKTVRLDKIHIYYIVMAFFLILSLIYIPFESSRKYTHFLLEKRFSLFGFALVGFFGVNNKFRLNYFLNTFIISSIITIIYLFFFRIGIHEFVANPAWKEVLELTRVKYVNSHMGYDLYLNISLISIWYILTRSWSRTIWWKRYMYIGALTTILSALSISEGRSGFIMGVLLMLTFIFVEIWKRRKIMGMVIGFIIPFLLIGIISQHKRMTEGQIKAEPRFFLWKSALSVIKENPVIGFGISDAQEKFDAARRIYETPEFRINWTISKHLDCHNQYLQTTMEFGIIGLLILLFLYISPVFYAEKNKKMLAVFLMFLCAYQSVFDMFITGPFSSIFCILVILILSVKNNIVKGHVALNAEE